MIQRISWASYQIRKSKGCACAGNAGNVFPAKYFKGNRSLTTPACIVTRTCLGACRDRSPAVGRKMFPEFPGHAQPAILCIWQEADGRHWNNTLVLLLLGSTTVIIHSQFLVSQNFAEELWIPKVLYYVHKNSLRTDFNKLHHAFLEERAISLVNAEDRTIVQGYHGRPI